MGSAGGDVALVGGVALPGGAGLVGGVGLAGGGVGLPGVLGAARATITSTAGDPFARGLTAAFPADGREPEPGGSPIGVMLSSVM